ncbi:MAG: hypothetical protein G3M70_01105 [Candidatus Nitronauta litoralis]|uniref:Uncharacterized protein n=1 Tax=Candidatus Nitronauta litoralis TaxID=2705533 RepID=A0A7T0BT68_9BACT|nr:MAG: hypothetical protein G3M70_01105 [Candidatus Nitronauta litoralis]
MILKDIYLFPDRADFDNKKVSYPFKLQARSLCVYLERQLKTIKFKTNDFNRVCFVGCKTPNPKGFVNSCNVLGIEIDFDEKKYNSLNDEELNPFFIDMLTKGIEKCEKQYDFPGRELKGWMEDFRKEGFVNNWVFKTRLFRSIGLKCSLICDLTLYAFQMKLIIKRGKIVIFDQEIKKTEPDDVIFKYLLKDIKLIENYIVVIDKLDKTIFEIPVQELAIH